MHMSLKAVSAKFGLPPLIRTPIQSTDKFVDIWAGLLRQFFLETLPIYDRSAIISHPPFPSSACLSPSPTDWATVATTVVVMVVAVAVVVVVMVVMVVVGMVVVV